jgi:tetratricopeptide (TPR) repeat protein
MRKQILFATAILFAASMHLFGQQPKWAKKVAKSAFVLKTFDSEGELKGSSNGFFIGTDGEAVGSFAPFRGASRAVAIDAQGKEKAVDCIIGGDDMYDLSKFMVTAKGIEPLTVASTLPSVGDKVWLMPYAMKKTPVGIMGVVAKIENVKDSMAYYTLRLVAPIDASGAPVLNENGEVIGILQRPATDKDTLSYAAGVKLASDMKATGLSLNDRALRQTKVKKALPSELEQAILTMYIAAPALDSASYAALVEDFIAKFPKAPDGYIYRAQIATEADKFAEAAADMDKAIDVADKKDVAHNEYAKLIYQKEIYKSDRPYADWSLDKAADEADKAYAISPMPVYKELKARIRYAQKRYDEAYGLYAELANTNLRSAELFYSASKCKERLGDSIAMVNLLDSAVNTFSKPYLKAAAPYLLARARALVTIGKYRAAVLDYNEYEKLLPTELSDAFYYEREQAELEGKLFQQAIDDLKKSIAINPKAAIYYAEKALVEIRVGMFDEAETTAQQCVAVDGQLSDGYLFLGYAQCLKGDKAKGVDNLRKAKELGNGQADALIEKYGVK